VHLPPRGAAAVLTNNVAVLRDRHFRQTGINLVVLTAAPGGAQA